MKTRPAPRGFSVLDGVACVLALAAGLAIAYVDSRPHWDDTGITVFAMIAAAGLLALLSPRRPWLLALSVGIWIPIHAIATSGTPGALVMFVVVGFPLAGAYIGSAVRNVVSGNLQSAI